jgi:methylenetetrahydrofolate--tRNA-(uracil-5-)-methyltransferase
MTVEKPTPSNINFGLLPQIDLTREQRKIGPKKKIRKMLAAQNVRAHFQEFSKSWA